MVYATLGHRRVMPMSRMLDSGPALCFIQFGISVEVTALLSNVHSRWGEERWESGSHVEPKASDVLTISITWLLFHEDDNRDCWVSCMRIMWSTQVMSSTHWFAYEGRTGRVGTPIASRELGNLELGADVAPLVQPSQAASIFSPREGSLQWKRHIWATVWE